MSNVQNVSRSIHLNKDHSDRYDMSALRFKGGGSVGLAPVGHFRLGAYFDRSLQQRPRAKDIRNIASCERSRHQQKRDATPLMNRSFQ